MGVPTVLSGRVADRGMEESGQFCIEMPAYTEECRWRLQARNRSGELLGRGSPRSPKTEDLPSSLHSSEHQSPKEKI